MIDIDYKYIYYILDWIIFIYAFIQVSYLCFFVVMAYCKKHLQTYPTTSKKNRCAVFFPAYKEDAVIENTIISFLKQDYPNDLYDIVVIADQLKQDTLSRLAQYPVIITQVSFKNSTKAKALKFAINGLEKKYDIAVILDADNHVDTDFLEKINNAFCAGNLAIQTHRIAKQPKTNMAILDATSEEINNTIFRLGHINAGLPAALIGSGMAFDFDLFKESITHADENHVGEDKQLEIILLRKRIFIEYLQKVYTYDEKISKSNQFFHQRRRWISTQFSNLSIALKDFGTAFRTGNWGYCDKLFQWTMPSRVVLAGVISIITIITTCFNLYIGIKWIIVCLTLLGALICSIPGYLKDRRLLKAMFMVPFLFILMIINHFRLAGASKKFIHTSHGE